MDNCVFVEMEFIHPHSERPEVCVSYWRDGKFFWRQWVPVPAQYRDNPEPYRAAIENALASAGWEVMGPTAVSGL